MDIGSFNDGGAIGSADGTADYPESVSAAEEWAGYEEVNAIGKGGYWQWPGKGKGKSEEKSEAEKAAKCFNCGKRGHIAKDCHAPVKAKGGKVGKISS